MQARALGPGPSPGPWHALPCARSELRLDLVLSCGQAFRSVRPGGGAAFRAGRAGPGRERPLPADRARAGGGSAAPGTGRASWAAACGRCGRRRSSSGSRCTRGPTRTRTPTPAASCATTSSWTCRWRRSTRPGPPPTPASSAPPLPARACACCARTRSSASSPSSARPTTGCRASPPCCSACAAPSGAAWPGSAASPTTPSPRCRRSQARLRELGFGYRARFVSGAARAVLRDLGAEGLARLRGAPYAEARRVLCSLPGVGAKVADCVCLMALDKPEAVPVDTHVWQVARQRYGLEPGAAARSLTPRVYRETGDFFRRLWGPRAGWAQAVLFCAEVTRPRGAPPCASPSPRPRPKQGRACRSSSCLGPP